MTRDKATQIIAEKVMKWKVGKDGSLTRVALVRRRYSYLREWLPWESTDCATEMLLAIKQPFSWNPPTAERPGFVSISITCKRTSFMGTFTIGQSDSFSEAATLAVCNLLGLDVK